MVIGSAAIEQTAGSNGAMVMSSGLEPRLEQPGPAAITATAPAVNSATNQILLPPPPTASSHDVYRRIHNNVVVPADNLANSNIGLFKEDAAGETSMVKDQNQNQNEKSDTVSSPLLQAGDSPLVPMPESGNQNGLFFGGGQSFTDHTSRTEEGVSYSQECTEVSGVGAFRVRREHTSFSSLCTV